MPEVREVQKSDLLIIACSAKKKQESKLSRAIELYDGPAYRVIKKQLGKRFSQPVVWIISAKHGLIDADTLIYSYDAKITRENIGELKDSIESFVKRFAPLDRFDRIFIWAGKRYLSLLPQSLLTFPKTRVADGYIGQKLNQLKRWSIDWRKGQHQKEKSSSFQKRTSIRIRKLDSQALNYLIPDWEDYLDPEYDFTNDRFSWESAERRRLYAHELFTRRPLYDGVLVSLGHIYMRKGFAKDLLKSESKVVSARSYLHLKHQHLIMGDCGAFSYRHKVIPPFSTEQVIKLYNSLKVDIGASIDHIPFGDVEDNGQLRPLIESEVEGRIELTTKLANEFLRLAKDSAKFLPMGVVQARSSDEYASIAYEYVRDGYQYVALGGLVAKTDEDILEIVEAVFSKINGSLPQTSKKVRIHLFGVLREEILMKLKEFGITSFDSGSYLRKAWLRSDKNYLSCDGEWYSAVRVPYSSDPRFRKDALSNGMTAIQLEKLERHCLNLLKQYDRKQEKLPELLDAIISYDSLLLRTSDTNDLREKYLKTLSETPWKYCDCPVCKTLGIDVAIFRGFNRNKRRGFHNTWVFYKRLQKLRRTGSNQMLWRY
jgi:queuine/archaeosine tRNA-ribosyltransferase